jgi:hypothetical protein
MKIKQIKFIGLLGRTTLLLCFCTAFLWRCASIMTPTGGPKDSLPPVITAMSPDNFTTNFTDRKIYIEFDEYVQLKDQQKEFYTSPQMKKKPTITLRGKGILIQLRDTLQENTTYALNFGSAIRDNNEGNPLHSMRYVFSTGAEIDSMMLSGYTADAYKADSVSKTFICFYLADSVAQPPDYDSTLLNLKPHVIARAETNGIFLAQNLKPADYRVYAYLDTNDNQMYEPSIDKVGFLDSVINPSQLPDFAIWYDSLRHYVTAEPQLYMRMFTDVAFRRQTLQQAERPSQHKAMLYFGAAHPEVKLLRFDSIPAEHVIWDPQTQGRDTVALWFDMESTLLPDTIRGEITYLKHDSINELRETTEPLKLAWRYIESKAEEKEREKLERERKRAELAGEPWEEPEKPNPFKVSWSTSGDVDPLNNIKMEFEYPLRRIDSLNVSLTYTTESLTEPQPSHISFVQDTMNRRVWRLQSDWIVGAKYELTIPKGAIENIANEQCDTLRASYTTADPEKFATIKLHIKGKTPNDTYVVQLLNGNGSLLQEQQGVTSGDIDFAYVPAGEVRIRVIEDINGNGKWDAGNLIERRQPERTEIYQSDQGESTFATKVNWEVELEIDMAKLFAPMTMPTLVKQLEQAEMQRVSKYLEEQQKKAKKGGDDNPNNSSSGMGFGSAMGGLRSTF